MAFTCTQMSDLEIHLNIHTGIEPFKVFSYLSYLKEHQSIHTKDKPF